MTDNFIFQVLSDIFSNKNVEYIHVHKAKPGCFNCAVHNKTIKYVPYGHRMRKKSVRRDVNL
ncbi:DUF1203 domain-containing protein [Vibrio rhizosphaerae]|uniref:DUF1203 domain-containing protein n=1 Tax=Vibrio rhizosphaerae TaxID=398736 RepID=UPI00384FB852